MDAPRTNERFERRSRTAALAGGIAWLGLFAGCFHEDDAAAREGVDSSGDADAGGDADASGTTALDEPFASDLGGQDPEDTGGSTGPDVDCTLDVECDDDNPCTIDVCETHDCRQIGLDGLRAIDQIAGDCRMVVCDHGAPHEFPDPIDVPDDTNDCTIDRCLGDVGVHDPGPVGVPCTGGAVCDGRGTCDECASPDTCNRLPVDDDCQVRTCVDGRCGQSFAPAGAPVNATLQTPGDCRRLVCDGTGGAIQESTADPSIDGLECTDDACTDGVADNPPLPAGTPCAAGECNALGQCVGCSDAADCGAPVTCQILTCSVQGLCGVADVAAGSPLPGDAQVAGNCQELRCDGEGAAAAIADDDDLPADANACTGEACNGGLPQHPDEAPGTPCAVDGGTRCDGTGACVVCLVAGDCPAAGPCELALCDAGSCGTGPAPAMTACSDGLFCTASDACDGAGACVGAGDPCTGVDADDDCTESCNEADDACDAADPEDGPCDDGLACTAPDTCTAGVCSGGPADCEGPGNCLAGCQVCCDD